MPLPPLFAASFLPALCFALRGRLSCCSDPLDLVPGCRSSSAPLTPRRQACCLPAAGVPLSAPGLPGRRKPLPRFSSKSPNHSLSQEAFPAPLPSGKLVPTAPSPPVPAPQLSSPLPNCTPDQTPASSFLSFSSDQTLPPEATITATLTNTGPCEARPQPVRQPRRHLAAIGGHGGSMALLHRIAE